MNDQNYRSLSKLMLTFFLFMMVVMAVDSTIIISQNAHIEANQKPQFRIVNGALECPPVAWEYLHKTMGTPNCKIILNLEAK